MNRNWPSTRLGPVVRVSAHHKHITSLQFLYVALPTAAAFGSLIPGFGKLFGFRILALLLIASVLFSARSLHRSVSLSRFVVLAFVWLAVGVLGLIFVKDFAASLFEFSGVALGLLLAYALVVRSPDLAKALSYLRRGWVLAFLITGVLAVREIFTGVHLSNYFPSSDLEVLDTRLIASVFGNPNAYGAFLITALPFVIASFLVARTRRLRLLYSLMFLVGIGLLITTGSRLCLIAMALELLLFVYFAGRQLRGTLITAVIIAVALIMLSGSGLSLLLQEHLPGKLAMADPRQLLQEILYGGSGSSAARRLDLYRDGLWMIGASYGLGVGPGQFNAIMASGNAPFDTVGVIDPHNAYLEVGAQYGILVLGLVLAWLTTCLRQAWRQARAGTRVNRAHALAVAAAVIGNSIGALANSTYLPASTNWVFLSTALLAAVHFEGCNLGGSRPDSTFMQGRVPVPGPQG